MTDELVAWIRAQLDVDAAEAERLGGEEWAWCFNMPSDGEPHGRISVITDSYCIFEQATRRMSHPDDPIAVLPKDDADKYGYRMLHMARHDPARVLRDIEAKRRIIADYERYAAERRRAMGGWESSEISPILTALAAVYADRDGYKESWKP